jgi:hypothetical protein
MWRQTQTAELTRNFAASGFSWDGLSIWTQGNRPVIVHYEFPIYNALLGLVDRVTGHYATPGKFLSFVAGGCCTLLVGTLACRLGGSASNDDRSMCSWVAASLFFIWSPVSVLMNTSYQPDSFGLAAALAGVWLWTKVQRSTDFAYFALGAVLLTTATMIKFPLVVPYVPVVLLLLIRSLRIGGAFALKSIGVLIVCLAPVVLWYVARRVPTFGLASRDQMVAMFAFGDLGRFLRPEWYVKPAICFVGLVLGGFGIFPLAIGGRRLPVLSSLAALGIVTYLVVIPTVADQYYYLYPTIPLLSIIIGHGFSSIAGWARRSPAAIALLAVAAAMWVAVLGAGWLYVLRQDRVTLEAAREIGRLKSEGDLVLFIPNHDRVIGKGSFNPSFSYLSGARGWLAEPTSDADVDHYVPQDEGVVPDWIVVTRYTPDLETPLAPILPQRFRNQPVIDSESTIIALKQIYEVRHETKNFVIFRCATTPQYAK